MTGWTDFATQAPRIAEVFERRHAATGNLCMLGTLRADGFPRISPMEPRFFEGELWLAGMPNTAKFDDLDRDPRYTLHTATVDTKVSDGDAKIWGSVEDVMDRDLRQRFAQALFDDTGFDIRDQEFDHFFQAQVIGAAAVEVGDGHLDVTVWSPERGEYVVRKH